MNFRSIIPVLLFSAVLFAVGITWGLPHVESWMSDDLAPFHPLIGLSKGFSFGYFNKYPLVHQLILALVNIPLVVYAVVSHASAEGFRLYEFLMYVRSADFASGLMLIDRLVSVAMGVGTVLFTYLGTRELFGRRAALWAAIFSSMNALLNFYAHLSKVEVPYVFWGMGGLYFLIKAVKEELTRDYVYTAIFACLSFGSKDQGYAIFVLPFIVYLVILPLITRGEGVKAARVLSRKNLLIFAAVFVIAAAIVENLFLNFDGLIARFHHLTGEGGTRSISYSLGPSGILALWRDAFGVMMRDATGIPVFLLGLLGIGLTVKDFRHERAGLLLRMIFLVALVSYSLFFVQIIRQSNVRFVFPQSVFLAVHAGYAADRIIGAASAAKSRIAGPVVAGVLALSLAYSLYNTLSVNAAMLCDSRYDTERWMQTAVPKGSKLEYYNRLHYLPRFPKGVSSYQVRGNEMEVVKRLPDFIVISSREVAAFNLPKNLGQISNGQIVSTRVHRRVQSGFADYLDNLREGRLGYVLAHRSEFRPKFFRNISSLNISPDFVEVYRRAGHGQVSLMDGARR
ncbi:MAG TPA: glycosyltransferase family 39 protein [Spirochaetota bacterium]|nr:glycosyltransferase family 39 protein [Spirochaetota bacterium]